MLATPPPAPADKVALRRLARERRKALVEGLAREDREALERQLAAVLSPLIANSHIVGGYCPMPSEISPFPALEAASARGATVAYPAFADHQAMFRFLAGDPSEAGPWACFQPPLDAP